MIAPQIDILMATRNGERYVGEQIASIQLQTHAAWRLLVSDDCSRDGALNVVRAVASVDPRVRVVSQGVRHGGAAENFMGLLVHAEAPYVMFCDQDDVWLPEKVERTLAEMRALEERHGADVPLLVFADMAVVDEGLNLVAPSFERYSRFDPARTRFAQLLAHNVAAGCTTMLNRPLARLCAEVCGRGGLVMHDWWAMLVASAFGRIGYVGEPLSLYRQHGGNAVGASGYAPVDRARDLDFMESQFRQTVAQAQLFADVYGSRLGAAEARILSDYVEIASSTLLGGYGA